jgi:predicted NUDIX family NTP pyrophosphohydrolase
MPKLSAGLLPYREVGGAWEVFLVHPGGPFWAKKDVAGWSIAKGEVHDGEELLAAAQREFTEETGFVPSGPYLALGEVRQSGGKQIHAWACAQDFDPTKIVSNTFTLEWPPRSGRFTDFPEIDRAAWFTPEVAAEKLHRGQVEFLRRLAQALGR